MLDYDKLRKVCEQSSRISARIIDEFLLSYTAGHQGMEKKMEQRFDGYRHITRKIGKSNESMLKSQYLAHRLFKEQGLLEKFLRHPALKQLSSEEREYLHIQQKTPWRFVFGQIMDSPAPGFFEMQDVFTRGRYLVYSPGMRDILRTKEPILWFNLLGYNGSCWQTYGPMVHYNGFDAEDIWFFTTELRPETESYAEVQAVVEKDPLPYMMLLSGASLPLTYNQKDQLRYMLGEDDLDLLDTSSLKKDFKAEYNDGVYKFSHEVWSQPPHFGHIWFDEKEEIILFTAMTDRSFKGIVRTLNTFGYDFSPEPGLKVNMTMLSTAREVLNRKIVLNEYEALFTTPSTPAKDNFIDSLNACMSLILPDLNAGRTPDIEAAARKTGADPDAVRQLVEHFHEKKDSLPDRAGKSEGKDNKKLKPASMELPVLNPDDASRWFSKDDRLLFNLNLYMMADRLRRLAPWDLVYEDDIFGVQIPGSELVYFVSVMGSEGEFFSLSFYKGFEGLTGFMDFRHEVERVSSQAFYEEGGLPAVMLTGGMMSIPHMNISYEDRTDLQKEQYEAAKRSGVPFRGKGVWPSIDQMVPGFVPAYPDQQSKEELYLVLQQTLHVLERCENKADYIQRAGDPEGTFLIRVPTGKGPKFKWKDHYLIPDPNRGEKKYTINLPSGLPPGVSLLPESGQTLQCELFMLPAPVKEKGKKAFFPFLLLLVDQQSGFVVSVTTLSPLPDLDTMHESIPQKLLEEVQKTGRRPERIVLRSDLLFTLLEDSLKKAKISIRYTDEMEAMDEAIESLLKDLS